MRHVRHFVIPHEGFSFSAVFVWLVCKLWGFLSFAVSLCALGGVYSYTEKLFRVWYAVSIAGGHRHTGKCATWDFHFRDFEEVATLVSFGHWGFG